MPQGNGFALNCQCFFCSSCFENISKNGPCPICKTPDTEHISLNAKQIPDEIKALIGNTKTLLDSCVDAVSFQTSHYKSVINAAKSEIKSLRTSLNAAEVEIKRPVVIKIFS